MGQKRELEELASRLGARSLEQAGWGAAVRRVLAAALLAVEPGAAVRRHLRLHGDVLELGRRAYYLHNYRQVLVVGAGKAGVPMTRAVVDLLGERVSDGLVVVKEGYAGGADQIGPVRIVEAGHPLPDERSVSAAQGLLDLLARAEEDDLVLCLLSGGGSALMTSPAPGVTLAEMQALTAALLASGATINEINTIRKHIDQVKGGGLARQASPATLAGLVLSDVVGDPLEVIASGPTVADPSTFAEALDILHRLAIPAVIAPAIRSRLEAGLKGELPETPKPGDPLFDRVQHQVIGSNRQAALAAAGQANAEGLRAILLTTFLQGEAQQAGRVLAAIAREAATYGTPLPRPACLIAGGETTVMVRGEGRGGRNQELALGAVAGLDGLSGVALVTLATDGGDGPTEAAGSVVTGETLARARQAGLDPDDFLARNDSYPFFDALGDLLRPGPTLTNVNDLAFIFVF